MGSGLLGFQNQQHACLVSSQRKFPRDIISFKKGNRRLHWEAFSCPSFIKAYMSLCREGGGGDLGMNGGRDMVSLNSK